VIYLRSRARIFEIEIRHANLLSARGDSIADTISTAENENENENEKNTDK
jgi:hypothetical protein